MINSNGTHFCILYINETLYWNKLLLAYFLLSEVHENIFALFLKEILACQQNCIC